MRVYQKLFLVVLILSLMALPLFAGGRSGTTQGAASGTYPTGRITYPISTNVTLTWWMPLTGVDRVTNHKDHPAYKGLMERIGINIDFIHPSGNANEQFNLMVASGDLPDIMTRGQILNYPGGPEKAISDGTVLKLNDYIDNYAPNFKDRLTADPQMAKNIRTDSGSYFTFPFYRSDMRLGIWQGIMIRKDWLDELGLQMPETYDDWYNVLTAFKTRKNSPAPLTMSYNNAFFMFGYGIDNYYNHNNGTVFWGRMEPAYRDYLTMINRWYREGLIDPDMGTLTGAQQQAKITNGTSGATTGSVSGNMGSWIPSGRLLDPNFTLVGTKFPVLRRGTQAEIMPINQPYSNTEGSVSIGGKTRYPELAVRFMDYGYSEEGHMYYNFGTLGQTYNMVNGQPRLTDLILRNPEGMSVSQAQSFYIFNRGPYIQDSRPDEQLLTYPEQSQAKDTWTIPTNPYAHLMGPVMATQDEASELAQINTEIDTYAAEMELKFMIGTEPLSNFDSYVATLRRMGVDRGIAIQTAMLRRYNAR